MEKLAIGIVIAALVAIALSVAMPQAVAGRLGEPREIDLFYGSGRGEQRERRESAAEVTVLEVRGVAVEDVCVLRVHVRIKNLGRKQLNFSKGFAQLRDVDGREYIGTNANTALGEGVYEHAFIDCAPGMTDEGRVWFKVPRDVLREQLWFGFVSTDDEDEVQARTLIFERGDPRYSWADGLQPGATGEWGASP